MMSASSQLFNLKSKPTQRHQFNGYSFLDGNPLLQSNKTRSSLTSESQEHSGPRSDRQDSARQSESPPLLVYKSTTATSTVTPGAEAVPKTNSQTSPKSISCRKTFSEDGNQQEINSSSSCNNKQTNSLFAKSDPPRLEKSPKSQKKPTLTNKEQDQSVKQIISFNIKQEIDAVGQQTKTQKSQFQSQYQQLLGGDGNPLNLLNNSARRVVGLVRNQALFSSLNTGGQTGASSTSNVISSHSTRFPSSQPFNHSSKFFSLDQQPQVYFSASSHQQKKRKFGAASIPTTQSQNTINMGRIPDIQEWFIGLSVDDRVLSLTIIDEFFTNSVQRMQSKINKNGQGLFKFQQRVVKEPVLAMRGPLQQQAADKCSLQQEFAFTSMKAILNKSKDQFLLQSKQIPEKEFLDYVRLTQSDVEISNNVGLITRSKNLNTITVSPMLVQNPQKFFELLQSIVGNNFLKVPLDVTYDDIQNRFNTKTPIWFDALESNSLAYWVIFYLEISLWVHYLAYVRGHFKQLHDENQLNQIIFIKKDKQFINLKNEIGSFWSNYVKNQDQGAIKELGEEIFKRTMKAHHGVVEKPQNANSQDVSQFHGGLTDQAFSKYQQSSDNQIMEVLLRNQDPIKFIQELCMISLAKVDDLYLYNLHVSFAEIIREKRAIKDNQQIQTLSNQSNSKNKKKKDKKKQKLIQKKQQQEQIEQNEISDNQQRIQITHLDKDQAENQINENNSTVQLLEEQNKEEEKKVTQQTKNEQQQTETETESEDEAFDYQQPSDSINDFCSNQQFITMKYSSPKNERSREQINEILAELMFEENKIDFQNKTWITKIQQKSINQTPQTPQLIIQSNVNKQDDLSTISQFEEKNKFDLNLNESEKENGESTDDHYEIPQNTQNCSFSQIEDQGKQSEKKQIEQERQVEQQNEQKKKKHPLQKNKRITRKGHQSEVKQENRDGSPMISTIQIIRSNKASENTVLNQQQQHKKKLKKRKNKNNKLQTQISNPKQNNQSNVLNDFIKSIIKVDEEEFCLDEYDEEDCHNESLQHNHNKRSIQQDDVESSKTREQDNNDKKTSYQQAKKKQPIKDEKKEQNKLNSSHSYPIKQVYVKKGTVQQRVNKEEIKQQSNGNSETEISQEQLQSINDPLHNFDKSCSVQIYCQLDSLNQNSEQSQNDFSLHSFKNQRSFEPTDIISSKLIQEKTQQTSILNNKKKYQNNNKKRNQNNNQKRNINYLNSENQGKSFKSQKIQLDNSQTPNVFSPIPQPSQNQFDNNELANLINLNLNLYGSNQANLNNNITMTDQQFPMSDQYSFQMPQDNSYFAQQLYQQMQQLLMQPQQINNLLSNQYNQFADPNQNQLPLFQEHQTTQEEELTINQQSEAYYQMLDNQMMKMVKDIEKLLESVRKERQNAITTIEGIVKETYKNQYSQQNGSYVGIKMYGSMASGLAIEQSDVDLAVVGLNLQGNKELQIWEMRKLCDQLEIFMKSKSSLKFIDTASVPVIKLQVDLDKINKTILKRQGSSLTDESINIIDEKMRFLGIDITFEDISQQQYYSQYKANHGVSCISLIQELIFYHPTLKPIVLVLKKILQVHNLNQPYLGGLNSYSLVLMTSAFLNTCGGVDSMSKNLREILNYYGQYFNPQKIMIEDQELRGIPSITTTDPMTVLDPLDKRNNITRSAFRIRDIQEIFIGAFNLLNKNEKDFVSKYLEAAENSSDFEFQDIIQKLIEGH